MGIISNLRRPRYEDEVDGVVILSPPLLEARGKEARVRVLGSLSHNTPSNDSKCRLNEMPDAVQHFTYKDKHTSQNHE